MATDAFVALYSTTLAADVSSVLVGGISNTYRDLQILINASTANSSAYIQMRFNGDTSGSYTYGFLMGNGSTPSAGNYSSETGILLTGNNRASTGKRETIIADVFDYNQTNKHKSVFSRAGVSDSTNPGTSMSTTRWASLSAVTSITFYASTGNLEAGSTFAIYGIPA